MRLLMCWGMSGIRAWGWVTLGLVLSRERDQGGLQGSENMLLEETDIGIGKGDDYIGFGRGTEVLKKGGFATSRCR